MSTTPPLEFEVDRLRVNMYLPLVDVVHLSICRSSHPSFVFLSLSFDVSSMPHFLSLSDSPPSSAL